MWNRELAVIDATLEVIYNYFKNLDVLDCTPLELYQDLLREVNGHEMRIISKAIELNSSRS